MYLIILQPIYMFEFFFYCVLLIFWTPHLFGYIYCNLQFNYILTLLLGIKRWSYRHETLIRCYSFALWRWCSERITISNNLTQVTEFKQIISNISVLIIANWEILHWLSNKLYYVNYFISGLIQLQIYIEISHTY